MDQLPEKVPDLLVRQGKRLVSWKNMNIGVSFLKNAWVNSWYLQFVGEMLHLARHLILDILKTSS